MEYMLTGNLKMKKHDVKTYLSFFKRKTYRNGYPCSEIGLLRCRILLYTNFQKELT